jgi:hypothetical protein
MPNPSIGSARRPQTLRPNRRPTSRTIRRRRAFVILTLAVAAILGFSLRPGPSGGHTVSVDRNASATHPSSSARAAVVRLVAASAGWRLASPISRAVAFADRTGIVVAGGLDAGQNTLSTVVHIDPKTGAETSAGSLSVPTHDAAGGAIGATRYVFGGGAQHVSDVVQALQPNGASAVVGHLPQPRADLAAATVGSTVYLIGGYSRRRTAFSSARSRSYRSVSGIRQSRRSATASSSSAGSWPEACRARCSRSTCAQGARG